MMNSRAMLALSAFLLLVTSVANSDSLPENTIPIISMKTGQDLTCQDITMDVLLMLLWHNFDGIWVEGTFNNTSLPIEYCDSTKSVLILAPGPLQSLNNWPPYRWGRYSTQFGLGNSWAFIHPDPDDYKEIDDHTAGGAILDSIMTRANTVYSNTNNHDCIWYFDIFNEGPARQLSAMLNDTSTVDNYFPSMFTQDTNMIQILPDGVFAWEKWKSDALYGEDGPTVSTCHSILHTLGDSVWAGIHPGFYLGDSVTQSNSVNAYFDMRYLEYSTSSGVGDTIAITPDRLDLNAYPIRLAGYLWQDDKDSITVLGSATDLWMLDHYELYMDSTFIPAGDHENGPFPIHYHPQAFGRTGGRAIWTIIENEPPEPPDTVLNYNAYAYRLPSPAEFRMLCNIGLLRGAKGVFPYSIRSYAGDYDTLGCPYLHDTGLLDENLIPFDAPYEDWVYRDRPVEDFLYAPPDTLPPWTAADGSQFDPLYTVPDRPSTSTSDPKYMEDYLEWKFAAYGRLWNSVRRTFRQIAWVAPELSQLWWWFTGDRYDNANIAYDSATLPLYFADPHIRVFTDSSESTCYLFYVNRYCRADSNPFEITVNGFQYPSGTPFSKYALDHSRRFLIEGDSTGIDFYTFLDTLDAGEARLLQMIDKDSVLAADIRITDPDVFIIKPLDGDTLTDNQGIPGDSVTINARFYNMGMGSVSDLFVYLKDETGNVMLDTAKVSFEGLGTDSCYKCDVDEALFGWRPDSTQIGVHVLRVYTADLLNEPDPDDNSATIVYLVEPRDYAAEVLGDPWDMTEETTNPPAWKTFDIDSLTGGWGSYTDSITGMFEGTLASPDTANGLYLNTGSGRDDWIDADLYHNFSIAGCSQFQTDITLHWTDSSEDSYSVDIQEDLAGTAADVGPVDISALSNDWTGMIKVLWLEFSGTNLTTDIRIGWVKLTE